MITRPLIEVCVDSLESSVIAINSGADRLELNSAIAVGGLTPSIKLLSQVKNVTSQPVICMIRSRIGNFSYSSAEFEQMLDDASNLINAGADGLAFGFVQLDGQIDKRQTEKFVELCRDKEAVFHRAIDCTYDISIALKQLIDLGIRRVLTSGGAPTAERGVETIKMMMSIAKDRIEILPGSGINDKNAVSIITNTGCNQVHGTFSRIESPDADFVPPINFNEVVGLKPNDRVVTCGESIQQLIAQFTTKTD